MGDKTSGTKKKWKKEKGFVMTVVQATTLYLVITHQVQREKKKKYMFYNEKASFKET